MSTVLVPDASVLLKWALRSDDDPDRNRALALKSAWLDDRCDLVVPTLWVYEVGNILGLRQPQEAGHLLAAMVDLGMAEVTPAAYHGRIFRLMRDHRVTFYDAAYHALAIERNATMLTADVKYVRKAGRAGHVQRLGDWTPPQ
ncbi:MAG: type II toxin-antitoxin system VapC family toxin [Acidobacteria bacterium]|nr:type II toxin-antitoxin system VapC family toxin [Acidobacteriota bacterium]